VFSYNLCSEQGDWIDDVGVNSAVAQDELLQVPFEERAKK
jgi:hypothetical protein